MSVKIYGIEDDSVIITGDIEKEFYSYNQPCNIILSNGLRISFKYENNRWCGACTDGIIGNTFRLDDNDPMTQILTINDNIEWCILDIDSVYELRETVEEQLNWEMVDKDTLQDLYIKFCKIYAQEHV